MDEQLKPGESFALGTSDDGSREDGYETREAAMTEGFQQYCEDYPEQYPGIYTCIVSRAEHSDHFPDSDDILERMREIAYDRGGEWADDYLEDVGKEEKADLTRRINEAITAWFEAHKIREPRYYRSVRAEQYHKYEKATADA